MRGSRPVAFLGTRSVVAFSCPPSGVLKTCFAQNKGTPKVLVTFVFTAVQEIICGGRPPGIGRNDCAEKSPQLSGVLLLPLA